MPTRKAPPAAPAKGASKPAKGAAPAAPAPAPSKPAKGASKPAAPAPAPAPAPAQGASKPAAPAPAPAKPAKPAPPVLPVGVYLNHNRNTAIVVKTDNHAVWYLTFITGQITCEHVGISRFQRDWPFTLPEYPIRRAVRLYHDSLFAREPNVEKILRTVLRNLGETL